MKKELKKIAAKRSKKEQKRLNSLNRIPTAPPTITFRGRNEGPRKKRWDSEEF